MPRLREHHNKVRDSLTGCIVQKQSKEMTINETAKAAYNNAVSKGFYENPVSIAERIALIHSEASEALEADRKGHFSNVARMDVLLEIEDNEKFKAAFSADCKSSFEDELADIIIRVMDLSAWKGIDLEAHIAAKMRYNSLREHKHGKKY